MTEESKPILYFVSSVRQDKHGGITFGQSTLSLSRPITGQSDIDEISRLLLREYRNAVSVCVTNWKRYEEV